MICQFCKTDTVVWEGPLSALTHTRCTQCGELNCQEIERPVETDDRYWDCDCAERYIQNKAEVPTCPNCGAHHADNPDSRVDEIANRQLHARPDLIEPSHGKRNVRHAHEYWLKLQANAALIEARTLNEVKDHWACGDPVENALDIDDPGMTDLKKLQMAHAAASVEAGRILYHMEQLHREIVRRGGRP